MNIKTMINPARNPEHLPEIRRRIASVIVLSGDSKVLMGRKDPDKGGVYPDAWHIPGGGVEDGESLEEAARREGLEEAGVDLHGIELVPMPSGRGETVKTLPDGERVWCIMEFNRFKAQLDKPAAGIGLHPTGDLVELRWFDRDELAHVKQVPGGEEFFRQAGLVD